MEEIVEMSPEFEDACRLCLTTDESRSSIFEQPNAVVPFADKIRNCTSIEVLTNDELPTQICVKCVDNINQWHSYKNICLQSQKKLNLWLQKNKPLDSLKGELKNKEHFNNETQITENNVDANMDSVLENGESENILYSNHSINLEPEIEIHEHSDSENEEESELQSQDEHDTTEYLSDLQYGVQSMLEIGTQSQHEQETHSDFNESGKPMTIINSHQNIQIKQEPMDSYYDDCEIDVESDNTGGQLVLNPLAKANKAKDRMMEADSTQKFGLKKIISKKKIRRGPHTHFRGARLFKKKCYHCNIYLHSKWAYSKHMEKYHNANSDIEAPSESMIVSPTSVKSVQKMVIEVDPCINENGNIEQSPKLPIKKDESEYLKMIKTTPLTAVQEDIISQLKTFSCYTCQQSFFDRRHTLNHIRQHMPDLRPYTCIACLTEFTDRAMYKLHCGASFECAMKIALVTPKTGFEKYFTCNMCLKSLPNREELLSHLSIHSDLKQVQQSPQLTKIRTPMSFSTPKAMSPRKSISGPCGPYMNGDPAHNHMCNLCGMIYRYRPNMFKHRELCSTLPENIRTSYRCVHCQMTFLVFKKFYSHVFSDHKKKEITCYVCRMKLLNIEEYLEHHETHRTEMKNNLNEKSNLSINESIPPKNIDYTTSTNDSSMNQLDASESLFNCALCGENFATKNELSEHRNLHLKVKIYSCVICRSMFSSSGALEVHMKDHGIDDATKQNVNSSCIEYARNDKSLDTNVSISAFSDPGDRNNLTCLECGTTFANNANLKRHQRTVHVAGKRRWNCVTCRRRFKSQDTYEEHMAAMHNNVKSMLNCPKCPKTFSYQGNLLMHCQQAHNETVSQGHSCDICGKSFREEQSLKTHRGWHYRVNYKLKEEQTNPTIPNPLPVRSKPAKARKSFPNNPFQSESFMSTLQCQVCDDSFNNVDELRKHLWDVHCSKNKEEKNFASELQCELCTNKFPDQESLRRHMEWHSMNPILSKPKAFTCDICGKQYSRKDVLQEHKKLHKVVPMPKKKLQSLQTKRPVCGVCHKSFFNENSLKRHKISHGHMSVNKPMPIQRNNFIPEEPLITIKQEPEDVEPVSAPRKKEVTCSICKIVFPNMSVLYQHKQLEHSSVMPVNDDSYEMQEGCVPILGNEGQICCNLCGKQFAGLSNLKQHFAHKHKFKNTNFSCNTPSCKLVFPSANALKTHELSHTSMIYSCQLCDRHVFNKSSIVKHMLTNHKAAYQAGGNKSTLYIETDLTKYTVPGAQGTSCPRCKIKYPNLRALKIHYFKFHDKD